MKVDGLDLDLSGLKIHPGLINAHDHLEFALFPRLGSGPYANATEWARDIYHPERDPVLTHLKVPKPVRLVWGGLRNLLSGVTTVSHHDPYHSAFDADFPVRVIAQYGWAHSFEFTKDVKQCFDRTPPGAPFIIHLAEGIDEAAAQEIFRLNDLGALTDRTVLVHAVGIRQDGWDLVRRTGASVIWCPRSNLFTLGRTLSPDVLRSGIPIALGTDSPLTAEGDFLDEMKAACGLGNLSAAREILRLPERPDDWIATRAPGEPPELVVIDGKVHLISPRLARPHGFTSLAIENRPEVLVRCDIPRLIEETRRHLPTVRLAGRQVLS